MEVAVVDNRDVAALRRREPFDCVGRRKVSVESAGDVEDLGGKIRASREHRRIVEVVQRADAASRQRRALWTTSPNRSRLLPTSVTLLSGRTLAIARFGWGEVGPRKRAGRGWQRFSARGVAVTPPRTAFGSPTLPLQGRVAKCKARIHSAASFSAPPQLDPCPAVQP